MSLTDPTTDAPDENVFFHTAKQIFPGGQADRSPDGKHQLFVVGNHAIKIHQTSNDGRNFHLAGSWYMHPVSGQFANFNSEPKDASDFPTETDLFGWLSWVRESAVGLAVSAFAGWLDPEGLYGEYGAPRIRPEVDAVLSNLNLCGMTPDSTIEDITRALGPKVSWRTSDTDYLLKVTGTTSDGHIVGRASQDGGVLDYAIHIPVGTVGSPEVIKCRERTACPPTVPEIKHLLLKQYVTQTYEHLLKTPVQAKYTKMSKRGW